MNQREEQGIPDPELGWQRQLRDGEELSGLHLPWRFPEAAWFADARVIHEIPAHLELLKQSSLEEVPEAVVEVCDYNRWKSFNSHYQKNLTPCSSK